MVGSGTTEPQSRSTTSRFLRLRALTPPGVFLTSMSGFAVGGASLRSGPAGRPARRWCLAAGFGSNSGLYACFGIRPRVCQPEKTAILTKLSPSG